jgi:hypothetical protein
MDGIWYNIHGIWYIHGIYHVHHFYWFQMDPAIAKRAAYGLEVSELARVMTECCVMSTHASLRAIRMSRGTDRLDMQSVVRALGLFISGTRSRSQIGHARYAG